MPYLFKLPIFKAGVFRTKIILLDDFELDVEWSSFKEKCRFIGVDWDHWIGPGHQRLHKSYGADDNWEFTAFEDANATLWDDSAAKHLQSHLRIGDELAFSVSAGNKHSTPLGQKVFVEKLKVWFSEDMRVRYMDITLRGA